MRILVCGGRDFYHMGTLNYAMNVLLMERGLHEADVTIIQGGAKGADFLAKAWADWVGAKHVEYPADWKTHGRGAGHIRNAQMLSEGKPDLVVAFKGGRGTADMVSKAKAQGLEVREVA